MIHEQVLAYFGRRMDIDAYLRMGIFRKKARDERQTEQVKFVGNAMYTECKKTGIGDNHLFQCLGGRIKPQVASRILV
ncbi:hypothetical protein SDC9_162086 [bioreactor metagenome]|uniref:Uncharacterized protein n=1 Tax=bioreactor metagenome TaxID=1076179 RepID=A0A645FK22_9ZZZZ